MQAIADEPADREVHLRLAEETTVVHDPEQQPGQHEPDCDLQIDAGPTIVEAIKVSDLFAQPGQVQNVIDPDQDVIIGQELAQ